MKEEAEFINLSIIYQKNLSGCKSDFARICGYPEKNKEFRNWLDKLIKLELLENNGNGDRKNIILYKPSKGSILKFIENLDNFPSIKRMMYDHYEGILRH